MAIHGDQALAGDVEEGKSASRYDDDPTDVHTSLVDTPNGTQNAPPEVHKPQKSTVLPSFSSVDPPDGGWGWVVCLASFWCNGTIFGILNTFGILYVAMLEEFDDGDSTDLAFKTSWVGALQISMTFFLSPVASIMADKFGIRKTGFLGAFLATLGMFLSSFVRSIELLYLTYGLLLGIGSSIIYNPSLVILGHYFKRRLGMVNGFVAFGSAVFTFVLPPLEKYLLKEIGLFNTMRVLAGLLAVLMLGSLTWKPLYDLSNSDINKYLTSNEQLQQPPSRECCSWTRGVFNCDIWKNRGYRVWAIALPIAFLGYFIPFVHLVNHTRIILPDSNPEMLVVCIGVTSGVSRLVFGKVADFPSINRIRMQQVSFMVLGVTTACIPFAKNFSSLVIITLVMGISDGCFICLLGPIAFDLLGPAGAAQGLGCMLGIASIPMTAGPPLAGLAFDYMKSYDVAFFAAGIPPLIAGVVLFLIPAPKSVTLPQINLEQGQLKPVENYEMTAGNFEDQKTFLRKRLLGGTEVHVSENDVTRKGTLGILPAAANHSIQSLLHLPDVTINGEPSMVRSTPHLASQSHRKSTEHAIYKPRKQSEDLRRKSLLQHIS